MAGNQIEIVLEEPIKIGAGSEFIEEQVITISAPPLNSSKAKENAIKLKALALNGFRKVMVGEAELEAASGGIDAEAKEKAQEELNEDKGENFLTHMAMAGADIFPMVEIMKELAPVVVKVGDGKKFEKAFWDVKISAEDQLRITGVFVKNFSLASIFSKSS
jgi:hypothetical protein